MLRARFERELGFYEISDGAVFTENYNETLDSGTIMIQQIRGKIRIEPYDMVIIDSYENGLALNTRRFLVDTYACTQTSLNPPIYKYEITLFSETKALEGIILPNLSITKRLRSANIKVYEALSNYLEIYGQKILSNGVYVNRWSFSNNVVSKFSDIECPEMQWNTPTLREVITGLMMVADCIPVVHNNVIDYIDISAVDETEPDLSGINYIQESQSSEDYVSELKMDLVNVANNSKIDGYFLPDDRTEIVERIGFRNNEDYLLTTENIRLQTTYPIWNIFYCKAYVPISIDIRYTTAGGSSDILRDIPITPDGIVITNYILEYREWQTKDVYYGDWSGNTAQLSTTYRNTCLYYTRGVNNIYNFNAKAESDWLFIHDAKSIIELIADLEMAQPTFSSSLQAAAEQYIIDNYPGATFVGIGSPTPTTGPVYIQSTFELSYEPVDTCTFLASKMPIPKHCRQVVDNQTNSYINVENQGLLEYMKANRLGNKMALINGRYYCDEEDMPQLSQKINDKIIFKKEISYYNNYINVNYLATENYVLRNYFTGVKSKLRNTPILNGNEAFVRADIVKFYVNIGINTINDGHKLIPSYTDTDWYLMNFNYCAIQFNKNTLDETAGNFSTGIIPSNTEYGGTPYNTNAIMKEFTKHVVKDKTVIFTIKMNDNRYDGNYVSDYEALVPGSQTNTRTEQKGIGYTDDNGEVYGCYICFYNDIGTGFSNEMATRGLKPLINAGMTINGTDGLQLNSADLVAKIPVVLKKDNKEITQISIQFEINDEADDIYIGRSDMR